MFSTTDSLGQIATTHPGASRVFLRHGLDFCCGGRQSLADATRAAGLDEAALVDELNAAAGASEDFVRWDEAAPNALIEHLLDAYHAAHREELGPILQMAQKVEKVHAERPDCPTGLYAHLTYVARSLEEHMQKEEMILFPNIQAGNGAQMGMPISVMESEHAEHAANLQKIRDLSNDLTPPADACNTWRALYLALGEFVDRVQRHVHLENNVLFPKVLVR